MRSEPLPHRVARGKEAMARINLKVGSAISTLIAISYIGYHVMKPAPSDIRLPGSRTQNDRLATRQLVGQKVPRFRLHAVDGSIYSTDEQIVGRYLLVFFSSFDCGTCLAESKYWQILHLRYGSTRVFGVTAQDNLNHLRRFLDLYHLTFPILVDSNRVLYEQLQIQHTPVKILVGENGVILKVEESVFASEKEFLGFALR